MMERQTEKDADLPLVLVTGSSGLIGTRVRRELCRDYRLVGLDLEPETPEFGPELACDLTDDDSVREAFAAVQMEHGEKVASMIHLAAHYDFSGEPSPLYEELTVEGTRRVLRALRGFDIAQFVFSSSLLVMKPTEPGDLIDEDSPTLAEWDYPRSKLAAESAIEEERGEIPAVVLRMAGAYDEDTHSIPLAQQMRRIYEKQLEGYFFPGNPEHGQSFLHLDDLMTCLHAVVDRRATLSGSETFLVGEPDVVGYAELQDLLGEAIHGKEWPAVRIPTPVAKAGAWLKDKIPGGESFIKPWMIDLADAHMPISVERAARVLGWRPERRLRKTLPEMGRRLVADPAHWYRENGFEPPEEAVEAGAQRDSGEEG